MSPRSKFDFDSEKLRLEYAFDMGVDFKNRTVRISGAIGEMDQLGNISNDFSFVDSALTELEHRNPNEPITVKINSPGGSVYEALAIVGRIKASPCEITTIGMGCIMSAATLILACGDLRKISKYCMSMFHQSSYGLEGSHEEVKEQVKQMEQEEKLWAKWVAELSNKSENFWYRTVKKKDVYLTADKMLQYGVIDEII